MGFLKGVGEVGTGICHAILFLALEAKPLLETFFLLFQSKLLDFHCVNIHGIGVLGSCSRGRGEGLEGLGGPSTSLSDLFHMIPLVLKVDGFGVPVVNIVWYGIEGHDLLHEQGRDSSSKETNQDVVVCDAGVGGVTLEDGDVTFQQEGELSILLGHSMDG